jgi:DNA-binding CsgD family transcriptional regulator
MQCDAMQESKQLLSVGSELVGAASFTEFVESAVPSLCDVLNAPMANCMVVKRDASGAYDYRWAGGVRGIEPNSVDVYLRNFQSHDPIFRSQAWSMARRFPSYSVLKLSDTIDERTFLESRFYHEFYRPRSIRWELAISVSCPGDTRGIIGFFRPRTMRDFSNEDVMTLRALVPAVAGGVAKLTALRELAAQNALVDILAQSACTDAVLVLDSSCRPIFVSDAGRALLSVTSSRRKATRSNNYNLPEETTGICRALLAAPRTDLSGSLRKSVRSRIPDGDPVQMEIIRIDTSSAGSRFLIHLSRGAASVHPRARLECLGLSRRQLGVAELLVNGLSNPQISEALHLSVRTIENHLRAIYAKAEVHSRMGLVRKVMAPPGSI